MSLDDLTRAGDASISQSLVPPLISDLADAIIELSGAAVPYRRQTSPAPETA